MKKGIEIIYWIILATTAVLIVTGLGLEGIRTMFSLLPITLPIVFNLLISCAFEIPRLPKPLFRNIKFIFMPFIFIGLIILYGYLNATSPGSNRASAEYIIYIFLLLQLITVIYQVIMAKGFRWLSFSVGLFSMWLSYWIGFYTAMNVTGTWL